MKAIMSNWEKFLNESFSPRKPFFKETRQQKVGSKLFDHMKSLLPRIHLSTTLQTFDNYPTSNQVADSEKANAVTLASFYDANIKKSEIESHLETFAAAADVKLVPQFVENKQLNNLANSWQIPQSREENSLVVIWVVKPAETEFDIQQGEVDDSKASE